MTIKERIKEIRKSKGLTLEKLIKSICNDYFIYKNFYETADKIYTSKLNKSTLIVFQNLNMIFRLKNEQNNTKNE